MAGWFTARFDGLFEAFQADRQSNLLDARQVAFQSKVDCYGERQNARARIPQSGRVRAMASRWNRRAILKQWLDLGGSERMTGYLEVICQLPGKSPSGKAALGYSRLMNADLKVDDSRLSRLVGNIPRSVRYLLVGAAVVMLASTIVIKGCEMFPESTFQLASESRLPKWITLSPGLTRSDVSITMSYYTWPSAGFVLQNAKGQMLENVTGKVKCSNFHLKNPPQGFPPGYPTYAEIVVKGTAEMIEHRKMEPVFYITDDPAVWKEYRTVGCDSQF